jgi:hypothetical protein
MSQNNGNQVDLDAGKYDCWAASNVVRIVQVKGERKAVVTVAVDVDGSTQAIDTWHTLDPKAVTSTGKRRIQFTIDSMKALGAVDPMRDIGLALKTDPTATEATVEGLNSKVACLIAKTSGSFMNYDVWAKHEPAPTQLVDDLLSLSDGGTKATKPGAAANPFAPRPGTGTPVGPPPARPKAAPPAADTSFDFGKNAPE